MSPSAYMTAMPHRAPRVTVLYQYMRPDDVVSARQIDGLCQGLALRGWEVLAMPSNREWRDPSVALPLRETWNDITYRRVWRPAWHQASTVGRLASAAWMTSAWAALGGRDPAPDAVIVGTDPVMSVAVAPTLKLLHPQIRVAHWAFDLYPEAAIADGLLDADSVVARGLEAVAGAGYRACDFIADIGPCMRDRLLRHGHGARVGTLVPWALSEPVTPLRPPTETRRELFGDAALGVLYSGSYGRAHAHDQILALARRLRDAPIRFCFGVRGNRADELRAAVGEADTNVSFARFGDEAELDARLASADVHLASLQPAWSGVVVPSKFFGALAAGRPVLFEGPRTSSLARWITKHDVGWVLSSSDDLDAVARSLRRLAVDRGTLEALWQRCHEVYHQHFARARTLDGWDVALRAMVAREG